MTATCACAATVDDRIAALNRIVVLIDQLLAEVIAQAKPLDRQWNENLDRDDAKVNADFPASPIHELYTRISALSGRVGDYTGGTARPGAWEDYMAERQAEATS